MKLIPCLLLPLAVNNLYGAMYYLLRRLEFVDELSGGVRGVVFLLGIGLAVWLYRNSARAKYLALIIFVLAMLSAPAVLISVLPMFKLSTTLVAILYILAFGFSIYTLKPFSKNMEAANA